MVRRFLWKPVSTLGAGPDVAKAELDLDESQLIDDQCKELDLALQTQCRDTTLEPDEVLAFVQDLGKGEESDPYKRVGIFNRLQAVWSAVTGKLDEYVLQKIVLVMDNLGERAAFVCGIFGFAALAVAVYREVKDKTPKVRTVVSIIMGVLLGIFIACWIHSGKKGKPEKIHHKKVESDEDLFLALVREEEEKQKKQLSGDEADRLQDEYWKNVREGAKRDRVAKGQKYRPGVDDVAYERKNRNRIPGATRAYAAAMWLANVNPGEFGNDPATLSAIAHARYVQRQVDAVESEYAEVYRTWGETLYEVLLNTNPYWRRDHPVTSPISDELRAATNGALNEVNRQANKLRSVRARGEALGLNPDSFPQPVTPGSYAQFSAWWNQAKLKGKSWADVSDEEEIQAKLELEYGYPEPELDPGFPKLKEKDGETDFSTKFSALKAEYKKHGITEPKIPNSRWNLRNHSNTQKRNILYGILEKYLADELAKQRPSVYDSVSSKKETKVSFQLPSDEESLTEASIRVAGPNKAVKGQSTPSLTSGGKPKKKKKVVKNVGPEMGAAPQPVVEESTTAIVWQPKEEMSISGSIPLNPAHFSDVLYVMNHGFTGVGDSEQLQACDYVGNYLVTTYHPFNTYPQGEKFDVGSKVVVGRCRNVFGDRVWEKEPVEVVRIDGPNDLMFLSKPTKILSGYKPLRPQKPKGEFSAGLVGISFLSREARIVSGVVSAESSRDGTHMHRLSTENGYSGCSIVDPNRRISYGIHQGNLATKGTNYWHPFTQDEVNFLSSHVGVEVDLHSLN
jgi:hypothetical protein